jgi:hypothetical protein
MPGSTEHQKSVRILYCNLMHEVRHRIDLILRLHEDHYKLPPQPAAELGYLQLRMVCETIALGCLAVHGEAPGARTAKIRSAHEADYILNALERLHPNFYPQPGVSAPHPNGGRSFIPTTAEYMTKPELLKLYWECGDRLHRGRYESAKSFPEADFKPVYEAALKLIELLKFHRISFLSTEDEMWVVLANPKSGKVSATLERPFRN